MKTYTELREADIEEYLCRQTKSRLDGRANKYTTPGRRSAPDRLLMWPGNGHAFVECKRPGEKPTPKQAKELRRLWEMGQNATWVDTKEKVDLVIDALIFGIDLDERFTEKLHQERY